MEPEKKHKGKRSAILLSWNESGGYGFCGVRDPNNPTRRQSWFIHVSRILRIEDPDGIIRGGEQVFFNEEANSRGPLAVDCEILSLERRIQKNSGLKALAGKSDNGGSR
jgi:hypothetical protein